jgi:hypothetical protein
LDNDDNPPTVEITILKDPDKAATKDNTEKKDFPAIEIFTGSSATMVMTTGHTRDQLVNIFKQGRQLFADLFDVLNETARAFFRDKKVFFEWLIKARQQRQEGRDP